MAKREIISAEGSFKGVETIKIDFKAGIGEFSKELPKEQGKYQQISHDGEFDKLSILKQAGIDHHLRYEAIANLPIKVFDRRIEEIKKSNEELTTIGIIRLAREIMIKRESVREIK